MSANHTPGPWAAAEFANECSYINAKSWTGLALVYGNYHNPEASDEGRANANLIAAAPELLAALKGAVYVLEVQEAAGKLGMHGCESLGKFRAAIAKATGEKQ